MSFFLCFHMASSLPPNQTPPLLPPSSLVPTKSIVLFMKTSSLSETASYHPPFFFFSKSKSSSFLDEDVVVCFVLFLFSLSLSRVEEGRCCKPFRWFLSNSVVIIDSAHYSTYPHSLSLILFFFLSSLFWFFLVQSLP